MMSRDAYKRSLAFFLFFATAAIGSPAQITFNTLVNFYRPTTGAYPLGSLVQGPDGNLYGTTSQGGTYDFGTVFRITPSGRLTTLYNFCAQSGCPDGNGPGAGLVQAMDGNLYGTTTFGGAHDAGTVFKISLSGALTTLYNFCAQPGCADGEFPLAGVIQASDGNFYGTTEEGGLLPFTVRSSRLPQVARSRPSIVFALSRTALTAESRSQESFKPLTGISMGPLSQVVTSLRARSLRSRRPARSPCSTVFVRNRNALMAPVPMLG